MTDTPPALHTPSDDPRVDILAAALRDLAPAWTEERGVRWRSFATDLLARLDAAATARDDALARWLDGEIAEADGQAAVAKTVGESAAAMIRLTALREVRDRLGVTTNDEPGEG